MPRGHRCSRLTSLHSLLCDLNWIDFVFRSRVSLDAGSCTWLLEINGDLSCLYLGRIYLHNAHPIRPCRANALRNQHKRKQGTRFPFSLNRSQKPMSSFWGVTHGVYLKFLAWDGWKVIRWSKSTSLATPLMKRTRHAPTCIHYQWSLRGWILMGHSQQYCSENHSCKLSYMWKTTIY